VIGSKPEAAPGGSSSSVSNTTYSEALGEVGLGLELGLGLGLELGLGLALELGLGLALALGLGLELGLGLRLELGLGVGVELGLGLELGVEALQPRGEHVACAAPSSGTTTRATWVRYRGGAGRYRQGMGEI